MQRKTFRAATLVGLFWMAAAKSLCGADETTLVSPDGQVQGTLAAGQDGLTYAVTFREQPVIKPSPLVIRVDGVEITRGAAMGDAARYEVNETYPWRGVYAQAVNHCCGARIPVTHAESNTQYSLEVRAFNDGFAFRYLLPGEDGQSRTPDEATSFVLPSGSTVWSHNLRGHYEAEYNEQAIEQIEPDQWAAPPVTFRLPGDAGYASITEAALVNYSGMALRGNGRGGFDLVLGHAHPISYPFELRYKEDIPRVSQPAAIEGTITSPWRVVLIGADLNALVNSDVIHNLCPPPNKNLFPDGINADWIKPGRAVWRYLDGGDRSLEGMKAFSRQAGELGFEYHVIEGFWSRWSDEEIKELVDYSREQGVGLFLWRHSNRLRTDEACEEFFSRLSRLGVAGAKIDFFDHEHREVVDQYPALLEAAARHKILVNFHGSNKPTGEPRTWPNELVRESVRGMESSRLQERARHDATLPFTRFLAGHADYTPVHFGARRADTTWAHQIATAAIFTAPLLTYAARPETILNHPAAEMMKAIPAIWDETRVLAASEIGRVAAFARRSGDVWFLAIVNGPKARDLEVPLSFLGEGEYRALLVRDDPENAAAVQVENGAARRGEALKIALSNGGGFIARFVKETPASAGSPRVFLWEGEHLRQTKERLRRGDERLAAALAQLREDATGALDEGPFSVTQKNVMPPSGNKHDYMSQGPYWWPNPDAPDGLPYIRRDGERNPEINRISDRRQLGQMCDAVETLALAYYFTEDETFAKKAAELLRAWYLDPATRMNPHFLYAQAVPGRNTGRGIGLIESVSFTRVVDAVGLLEGSAAWTGEDQQALQAWFAAFLKWMQESDHGRDEAAAENNHGTYYDVQVASFALFLGDKDLARSVLQEAGAKRIASQVEPDGRQPRELARTKSWGYSTMNLRGLMQLARLGEQVGVDLWNYQSDDGRSLRRALDFLAPYALEDQDWPYQEIGGVRRRSLDPLLRQAALKFDDEKYRKWAANLPEPDPDDRSNLVR